MSETARICYVCGPMSGLPGHNHAAFNKAAADLRAKGWTVFNPAETDGGSTDKPRAFYLRHALKKLIRAIEVGGCVVTLPGAMSSDGGFLEVTIARALGAEVVALARVIDGQG